MFVENYSTTQSPLAIIKYNISWFLVRDQLNLLLVAGRFGHVIVIPKDGGHNMLKSSIWEELMELDRIIRNAKAKYENDVFTYEQICARWLDECFTNDILNLHRVIE